jgi:hypothetical protein
LNPGRRGWKPATNRFSYGAAFFLVGLDRVAVITRDQAWDDIVTI